MSRQLCWYISVELLLVLGVLLLLPIVVVVGATAVTMALAVLSNSSDAASKSTPLSSS